MDFLDRIFLQQVSRRSFLKLSGSGLLALFCMPWMERGYKPRQEISPEGSSYQLGRIVGNRIPVYDRPSVSGTFVKNYYQDLVLPIDHITLGDDEPHYNRIWYHMNGEGYVHSGNVQPVALVENQPVSSLPETGRLAEISVPYTDSIWTLAKPDRVAYRLYYNTVHWVTESLRDQSGQIWYRIPDDKWDFSYLVRAEHMRLLQPEDVAPISPGVPPEAKRLEIRLAEQVVIAYEGGWPVYMCRTATGARFIDGDYRTQPGRYITNRKRPSRHMAAGDPAAPSSFDLPGIPWVCYLTENGVSFHGTYWHNDFGKPRSHGCINLSCASANWVYRWTNPVVPFDKTWYLEDTGTVVDIIGE
ncbi:MAG TPA: L,D-transpeptidase [Anaerolineaceae bacterium]|nr:L,D-transpeptidase [Anaerolineaceae bacterium]